MEAPRRCDCGNGSGPVIEIWQDLESGQFNATIMCKLCKLGASWSREKTLDAALRGLLKQWALVNPFPVSCAYCGSIPVQTKLEDGSYQIVCSANWCKQRSPVNTVLVQANRAWNKQQEAILKGMRTVG